MFKSTSTSLILLGTLAVIVGIIAIAWPSATILALVILLALISGVVEIAAGFGSGHSSGLVPWVSQGARCPRRWPGIRG